MPATTVTFWLIAAVMVAIALAFVLPAFLLPQPPATMLSQAATGAAPRHRLSRLALVPALVLPVLAFSLYSIYGDPGAVSGGGATSLSAALPLAAPASRDELVSHLERNPGDGRGFVLLARMEFESDRFTEAAAAYARGIEANAKVAADPAVWCEYADAVGMAQGGRLAGKPRELVLRALALNPAHPAALEMAGGAAFEAQEYATAARYWRELLAQLPAQARARIELEAAIARADGLASP
jgi:cytochrome c-type biogenesis protein CcmH